MKLFTMGNGSLYFHVGPVFHKALEAGWQWRPKWDSGIDLYWRFRTRGDHAGLTVFVHLWRFFFEFNVHDTRHWDGDRNRFEPEPDEFPEGCEH